MHLSNDLLIDAAEVILPIEDSVVDGVYTRIMHAPQNCLIIGAEHRKGGTAVLLSGTIRVIDGDTEYEITSPCIYNTESGTQKIGYSLTEVTFATMHSVTASTTIEAEAEVLVGTPQITRIRNSFKSLLLESGADEAAMEAAINVKEIQEEESNKYYIAKSNISGYGSFTKLAISKGDTIAMSILGEYCMPTAKYVNHSDIPNAMYIAYEDSVALVATKNIVANQEIFVDYRERICTCLELLQQQL